jgi:hypothetical protein
MALLVLGGEVEEHFTSPEDAPSPPPTLPTPPTPSDGGESTPPTPEEAPGGERVTRVFPPGTLVGLDKVTPLQSTIK